MSNKTVSIGTAGAHTFSMDLLRLVDTRMLLQANSGGGKSWLLRLIAEKSADKVQVIILDPEGEFATLRERIDMVLAGREGEIQTSVRAAPLLARRLVEIKVSAVVDLYDLKVPDRRKFVRLFLESLLSLPRSTWHPLLLIIDEAHLFCPERSAGEAESTQAVIDLMSQGRKRGFSGIMSTQRLSKLHKDAAAEANNVVIGRTWLDVDQKRAGDMLGFASNDRQVLRDLAPGQFYAFGPAFSMNGVTLFKSEAVKTTHPKAGERHKIEAPRASAAIRDVVQQFKDLPAQAETEIKDLADAKKRIVELERQLRAGSAQPNQEQLEKLLEAERKQIRHGYSVALAEMKKQVDGLNSRIGKIRTLATVDSVNMEVSPMPQPVRAAAVPATTVPRKIESPKLHTSNGTGKLSKAERKILTVLAQFPDGRTKVQIALLTGYAHSGGGFNNALSALRSQGMVNGSGEQIRITDEGIEAVGPVDPLPTGHELFEYWCGELSKAERAVLTTLYNAYPGYLGKESVADAAGYEASGGGFNNALSRLRTLELISGRGDLRISEIFFEGAR